MCACTAGLLQGTRAIVVQYDLRLYGGTNIGKITPYSTVKDGVVEVKKVNIIWYDMELWRFQGSTIQAAQVRPTWQQICQCWHLLP